MRVLKLSIHGIQKTKNNVKAFAEIVFIPNVLGMDMSTPCCRLDVSAPYKAGNTLEQYEAELTANAKECITELYKELVCGGEMDSELVIGIQGKCATGYNVKVISKNGKLHLSGDVPRESGETSSMWDVELDEKRHIASGDTMGNVIEKRHDEEALDDFLKRFELTEGHFIAHSFKGFHEAIEHNIKGVPGIFDAIPISIEIDANPIAAKLVPVGIEVFCHERGYTEGTFTKIGPFYLQIQR